MSVLCSLLSKFKYMAIWHWPIGYQYFLYFSNTLCQFHLSLRVQLCDKVHSIELGIYLSAIMTQNNFGINSCFTSKNKDLGVLLYERNDVRLHSFITWYILSCWVGMRIDRLMNSFAYMYMYCTVHAL